MSWFERKSLNAAARLAVVLAMAGLMYAVKRQVWADKH